MAVTGGIGYQHFLAILSGIILGLILVAAGVGKILHPAAILDVFFNYFPRFTPFFLTSAFTDAILVWLPRAELVIGVLLITGVLVRLMSALALLLVAGFTANNIWLLNHGQGHNPCGCFGTEEILGITLTNTTALYLDIAMVILALASAFYYRGNFVNIYPWFIRRGENG